MLVSGSNMSGKSTLLRTVGINTVLANAGAPVRAKSLRLSPARLGTRIRSTDSLQEGRSNFFTEILHIRQVFELALRAGHPIRPMRPGSRCSSCSTSCSKAPTPKIAASAPRAFSARCWNMAPSASSPRTISRSPQSRSPLGNVLRNYPFPGLSRGRPDAVRLHAARRRRGEKQRHRADAPHRPEGVNFRPELDVSALRIANHIIRTAPHQGWRLTASVSCGPLGIQLVAQPMEKHVDQEDTAEQSKHR